MIQFDPALAVPAGGAAAPSGLADSASGDAPFHDFLRVIDRRRDGDEELRQREARHGTEPRPAAPAANASTAAEPPRENSPPGDAPAADRGTTQTGAAAERPSSAAAEAEASDEADESRPEEGTVTTDSGAAAAIGTAPAAVGNPSTDAPLPTDDGPSEGAVASQAISPSAHAARRRGGPGAPPQGAAEPSGPDSAAQGAAGAASEQPSSLAEPEDALDSTQPGKQGGKEVGASGARTPTAAGQTAPAASPSPALAAGELAIGVTGGDPGSDGSQEGRPSEGETSGEAARGARSRRDHRRISAANDAASPNSDEALETASDGGPAGSTAVNSRAAGVAVASPGGLAESSAIDLEGGLTASIAAVEPGSPTEQGRLGAPSERVAGPLGERDGASGKTAGTTALARGSAEPSAQAADRTRFVQRVMHALQAAEARGTAVRLRLSPPELGSLRLELSVRDGALLARLEVETSSARSLLLDSLPQLRERLAAQEIKIERFEVDLMNQHASDWSHGARDQEHAGNAGRRGLLADGEVAAPSETVAAATAVHLLDAGGINVLV